MDRSRGAASPGLTLALLSIAHAAIHAQSALMPLVYPIVIVEFGLNAADIGTFIAVTTAVGGSMQLAYGFLTRHPRPRRRPDRGLTALSRPARRRRCRTPARRGR